MPSLPNIVATKQKHFGLSIGRTSLRVVEVTDQKSIPKFAEIELAPTIFSGAELVDKKAFGEAVKKVLEMGKIHTRFVGVCFSEAYSYTREYSVPLIASDEIQEAVALHVKDLFPFPEKELYFDWKLLEKTEQEYRVLVVAVQKQVIDPIVESLVSIGLKPLGFEPGASAIARLLQLGKNQKVLLTEINRQGAYVTLVDTAKNRFTTVVNYGAEDTPETYFTTILQTITELDQFYRLKRVLTENDTVEVVLTGELASVATLEMCKKTLKYPIKILQTPLNNPAFNKAYAVAASPLKAPADMESINVLPFNLQHQYEAERARAFFLSLCTRTLVVCATLAVLSFTAYILVMFERQRLEQDVKRLTELVKVQNPETQNLLTLNAQAKLIVSLAPLKKTPKDKLAVLKSIIPPSIAITSWQYDNTKLLFTLQGQAEDRAELLNFTAKLEDTGEFTKINLPLESLTSPKDIPFVISFLVKD